MNLTNWVLWRKDNIFVICRYYIATSTKRAIRNKKTLETLSDSKVERAVPQSTYNPEIEQRTSFVIDSTKNREHAS